MKLTEEQLKALIKDQLTGHFETVAAELGGTITEKVRGEIEEQVKGLMTEMADNAKKNLIAEQALEGKSGFKGFPDFAQQVYQADIKGGPGPSTVMKNWLGRAEEMAKAVGDPTMELAGTEGYLIPTEFSTELLKVAVEKANIFDLCQPMPMGTNALQIPYIAGFDHSGGLIHGGIEWKWVDEKQEKIATKPEFGKVELRLKKAIGMCYATDEILQDSPITMAPLLTVSFTDALAWTLDGVALNGTGAGQPMGIYNAPALVQVAIEEAQAADTIVYENIVKMYSRMWRKKNGVWFANDNTFPQLATMSLAVGVAGGSAVYLPAGGASGKPFDTLMGKPLVFTEHCRALGDLGDIYFSDFSQYLIGQRATGLTPDFATSIHLKFDYDQTAFRFVIRVDGQPWWPSAMTPRYSPDELSPFVALAARA